MDADRMQRSLTRIAHEIVERNRAIEDVALVGIRERVEALHAHHEDRLRALEEECEAPKSAAELLATLFPRALDTHQTMFAMGEAIAHLNRLEKAGRLTRSVDAEGVIRFKRMH